MPRRLMAIFAIALLLSAASSAALAVGTLNIKPAGTITIDGNTNDWNLAEFTTKTRGGQNQSGDTVVVGFDGGTCYYGGYWTNATLPTSASDHTAKVYCRADSTYIYFLVRCDDNQMNYAQSTSYNWANDCVEIYIDPSHDHGSSSMNNSTSDVQLVIDANNRRNVYMTTSGYRTQILNGVTSAVVRDGTGWWMEARVQKSVFDPDIPSDGSFGVDFVFRDNDNYDGNPIYGENAYSTMYSWNDYPSDASFTHKIPDRWGDAYLPPPSIRFNVTLDNGTTVAVDNASSWTNNWVYGLVLAADRSTQEDTPYSAPNYKGLMRTGDRVCVTDNYIAWFDYTSQDGINFSTPPYSSTWERSGALAGWWSLNPANGSFRYYKTGPSGDWNWSHNELIPGSCSPNQEQHWWDKYAPAHENSLQAVVGGSRYFMSFSLAKWTANSQWASVLDGYRDAAGVHYKCSALMTTWNHNVDVSDDNDSNGIANTISSDLEYVCRPDDILVIWNFKPNNANVSLDNAFIYFWTAYAQDVDNTGCDAGGAGSQWPGTVYGQPLYNQSNLNAITSWNGQQYGAGSIFLMVPGQTCSNPYVNQDIYSTPSYAVTNGSYMRCGEAWDLSINSPRWQFYNIGVPNTGSGTQNDPIRFPWDKLINWNETHDGDYGFGVTSGPYSNPADFITLQSGNWYRAEYAVRTNF